ncbi:MAG TPA: RNA pyrophosphohydrolase [Xanthobacteraceae bacterium]|nr:RNA pyrophosphohydrolase [Xanthobacteraceae bacterium]
MSAELPYRPCVGVVLVNRDGLVFLGRRTGGRSDSPADAPYAWQMPQGGIDDGEVPLDAALRELYEETNVRSARLIAEAADWLSYDLPSDVIGQRWRGRYRGQTQKWFALRFTGDDSEIDVARPGGGAHKPEFSDWRWERLDRTPDLIVPFKRPVYERVVAEFLPHLTAG